jgi:hypothetical protein
MRQIRLAAGALAALVVAAPMVQAGPTISAVEGTWDAGVITEGAQEFLRHSFVIKNTGDAILRIKSVRPG